jgi:hypothetical protein
MTTSAAERSPHVTIHSPIALVARYLRGVVVVVAAFGFWVSSAAATPYHPFLSQNTGSGSPAGAFSFVCGTAVDGNGAVYAADNGNNVVDVFDSSGSYLTQISDPALSGPCGLVVDSAGDVYVRNVNLGNVVELNPSSFPVTGATTYSLDKHLGESAPGAGDGNGVLDASNPTGVAIDPADGHVFVAESTQVQEYDAAGAAVGLAFGSGSIAQSSGVAVGAGGNVYVSDIGVGQVEVFSAGALSSTFNASDSPAGNITPSGIGVDPASGHVYVVDLGNGVVDEFDSAGAYQARITAFQVPQGAFGLADPSQVAVSSAGEIYLTDGYNSVLDKFGPVQNSTPPTASIDPPGSVTGTTVHLSGAVNPQGLDAKWHFEYVDDADYQGSGFANATPIPSPDGDAGSGTSGAPVSADPTGLQPNTLYHVRLVASNNLDPATSSSEQTFTTPPVPPEATDNTPLFNLTRSSVVLHANLNDFNAQPSDCHFEYGTGSGYGRTIPCDQSVAAGPSPVAVGAALDGLTPGTTYHYRLDAASVGGSAEAEDATFTTPDPATPTCTNAALRTGPSANLPDCRAYEQVSPVDKNGGAVTRNATLTRVAPDGDAATFASTVGFGDANAVGLETEYMSTRGDDGWSTHNLYPALRSLSVAKIGAGDLPGYLRMTPDLTAGVFASPFPLTIDPMVANIPNLYSRSDLRTPGAGSYQLMTACPGCSAPIPPYPDGFTLGKGLPEVDGMSADGSHVIFTSRQTLTTNAPGSCLGSSIGNLSLCPAKLYEWANGAITLAGILPDGTAAASSDAGQGTGSSALHATPHTISADGSRVIFTDTSAGSGFPDVDGDLYERIDESSSVKLNASEKTNGAGPGGTDPGGPRPATYWDASTDAMRVFFTSTESLTNDAPENGDAHLYMYDFNAAVGRHLTYIDGIGNGGVIGASADGHWLYFTSKALRLTNQAGDNNGYLDYIYVWHDGQVRLAGSFDAAGTDTSNLDTTPPGTFYGFKQSRVSPDGRHLLFITGAGETVGPTGYRSSGSGELYLYDATNNALTCASCNPSGATPTSDALGVALTPGLTLWGDSSQVSPMSADGRYVFFSSRDKLVPEDTNGVSDAYEFDSETGQLHLLSRGSDPNPSYFLNATPDGSNALILTSQQLVAQDGDTARDLYDARIDGGIAAQMQPPPPPPCSSPGGCQGTAAGAPGVAVGSMAFIGPRNPPPQRSAPAPVQPVRILGAFRHGAELILNVAAPSAGRLTVSGAGIAGVSHRVGRAGRYRLVLGMSSRERRLLRRRHTLTIRVHVSFAPVAGPGSSTTLRASV